MAQTLYDIVTNSTVEAADLGANLRKGFIPLDLSTARVLNSNAIINTTEGGVPDGNTDPILARINGATDIVERLTWAANSVVEVQFPNIPKPPDLDDTADVLIKLLIDKDTNTNNAAVIAVKYFEGIGDTNAGGNTAALATADLTAYTVTILAANVAAAPGVMSIALVPGAHANDAFRLHGAWIEYTRKT